MKYRERPSSLAQSQAPLKNPGVPTSIANGSHTILGSSYTGCREPHYFQVLLYQLLPFKSTTRWQPHYSLVLEAKNPAAPTSIADGSIADWSHSTLKCSYTLPWL